MKTLLRAGLFTAITAACLLADVTFHQTVQYTGGTLPALVRKMASDQTAGRAGAGDLEAAFQDQRFTVYIKGSKMARSGTTFSSIFDLDAGTVTAINHQKRTYSVMSFEEMRRQMEQVQQRVSKGQPAKLDFDVKVNKGGQTRDINGQTATEALMTLTSKSGGPNGQMVVRVDAWLVPLEPATREIVTYSRNLSAEFGEAFAGSPMWGAASAGIGAAMQEASKLDGYSVFTDVEVSGVSSSLLAAMGSANNDSSAPLIKMEVKNSNFASGAVDDSNFAIPEGYTEQTNRH